MSMPKLEKFKVTCRVCGDTFESIVKSRDLCYGCDSHSAHSKFDPTCTLCWRARYIAQRRAKEMLAKEHLQ